MIHMKCRSKLPNLKNKIYQVENIVVSAILIFKLPQNSQFKTLLTCRSFFEYLIMRHTYTDALFVESLFNIEKHK